jgi:hypothetical protein
MHASRFALLGFFCTHPFLHMQCVRATFLRKPFGPVHLAYNLSYLACFLTETVFFSHKKSANSVF